MKLFTSKVVQQFKFKVLNAEHANLDKEISYPGIHRIGLELAGVYNSQHSTKQVIGWGTKEGRWLIDCGKDSAKKILQHALHDTTPLIILSNGVDQAVIDWIVEIANEYKIAVVSVPYHLSHIITFVGWFLASELAPTYVAHGSLVEVHGVGVMIVGPSGIGKSEAVLELVQNGNIFISDDSVVISQIGQNFIGRSSQITKGILEARGIGMIDMQYMYGSSLVKDWVNIELVIELVVSSEMDKLDRLGNQILTYKVFESSIPLIKLPVSHGRNIAALISAAIASFIARKNGMDTLAEMSKRLKESGNNE